MTVCGLPDTLNADVLNDATPLTSGVAETCGVPSTVNNTDPVGTPAPDDTVAVNVTFSPNTDGLLSDSTTVELSDAVTIWSVTEPELGDQSPVSLV